MSLVKRILSEAIEGERGAYIKEDFEDDSYLVMVSAKEHNNRQGCGPF